MVGLCLLQKSSHAPYDMTAEWPADHTNEPNLEKKAWTRKRQKLARCTGSFSSEKSFSFLGPFTQGFVWFLPKGHTCGPSSISLIISVDKPLKNLISFYNSPSFWLTFHNYNSIFDELDLFNVMPSRDFSTPEEKTNAGLRPLKHVWSWLGGM